jgi:peptidoglycan/LPS O-acetylase OafA/YrhL
VRRVVVFRIDSIAYGFLLYLVLQRATFEWNARLRLGALLLLAATTIALLDVNARMLVSDAGWLRQINPFVSAAFGMSTLIFFLSINSLLQAPWKRAVSAYLGHISYPIYLFHLVTLYVLARYLPQHNELWHFVPYVTAVVLFTTLFHYGFERPILAARPRYPQVAATGVAPIHDPGKVVRLQQ